MEESKERHLTIKSYLETGAKPIVVVEVSDTGKGFLPENAQTLFMPFYTSKKVGQGTGLGLSVSLNIIKEHNGVIDAHGEPGNGATFIIKLPTEELIHN